MTRHYPPVAGALALPGRTQIDCIVTVLGRLADCSVASESPKGFGFGAASLAMSKGFRMKPKTVDGKPVGDGDVSIPVTFTPPPLLPEAGEFDLPPDERDLAFQFLDLTDALQAVTQGWAKTARLIRESPPDGASAELREAAAAAFEAAAKRQEGPARTALAAHLARVLSRDELQAIVAFRNSPAQAVLKGSEALKAYSQEVSRNGLAMIRRQASAAYCPSHACSPTALEQQAISAQDPDALDEPHWTKTSVR